MSIIINILMSAVDLLAQLYAFIKCLRAGIHQSIMPNRRTAKIQQQSMDLLHRIGDATIVDFADPRSSAALESLRQQQEIKVGNQVTIANEEFFAQPNTYDGNQQSVGIVNEVYSYNDDTLTQFNGLSLHSSLPKSIASGLSFASAMTSATRMSSSSFSSSGTSASRTQNDERQSNRLKRERNRSFAK